MLEEIAYININIRTQTQTLTRSVIMILMSNHFSVFVNNLLFTPRYLLNGVHFWPKGKETMISIIQEPQTSTFKSNSYFTARTPFPFPSKYDSFVSNCRK